ncbi:protein of unknown function [Nitrospina watsonii]|uniref:Uncharacterized protein n=1 Tax=Nitrospina watsonii TaxID=1323948 RepID=A0ABN8W372_9BACT|nr:protein of unknown function [Nitrospina watsonii]
MQHLKHPSWHSKRTGSFSHHFAMIARPLYKFENHWFDSIPEHKEESRLLILTLSLPCTKGRAGVGFWSATRIHGLPLPLPPLNPLLGKEGRRGELSFVF